MCAGFCLLLLCAATSIARAQGDPRRGAYLAQAGGCVGCHTAEETPAATYAGGRALKTPFGTFYGPNITPHPQAGIGPWTEVDFIRAMRRGERPDGASYYPAFPYPSFTRITDADLRDLWAFLRSLAPNAKPSQPHELGFLYRWRPLLIVWKWLFFNPGPFSADPKGTPVAHRGAYLAQALGHCGECHSPRNFFGVSVANRFLAGGHGPGGKRVPNLTPTRLGDWSDSELREFLTTGARPDGDAADKIMDEVIRNTTSRLTTDDLTALIVYLRSLPALPDEPKSK